MDFFELIDKKDWRGLARVYAQQAAKAQSNHERALARGDTAAASDYADDRDDALALQKRMEERAANEEKTQR